MTVVLVLNLKPQLLIVVLKIIVGNYGFKFKTKIIVTKYGFKIKNKKNNKVEFNVVGTYCFNKYFQYEIKLRIFL